MYVITTSTGPTKVHRQVEIIYDVRERPKEGKKKRKRAF